MDKLGVYKKYFETASDNTHLVMHRGYALALVKMVEELKNELTGFKLSNQSLSNSLDKEIKENERLREALKFYADKERYEEWDKDSDLTDYIHDIDFDGGDTAREALGISQTENE